MESTARCLLCKHDVPHAIMLRTWHKRKRPRRSFGDAVRRSVREQSQAVAHLGQLPTRKRCAAVVNVSRDSCAACWLFYAHIQAMPAAKSTKRGIVAPSKGQRAPGDVLKLRQSALCCGLPSSFTHGDPGNSPAANTYSSNVEGFGVCQMRVRVGWARKAYAPTRPRAPRALEASTGTPGPDAKLQRLHVLFASKASTTSNAVPFWCGRRWFKMKYSPNVSSSRRKSRKVLPQASQAVSCPGRSRRALSDSV